jgi:uroporphyrinogen decarboxylase
MEGINTMAMTRRERVEAAVRGDAPDRTPICFWHHFKPKGSPQRLAEATARFFGTFDLDIFKIMPDIPYPFPRAGIKDPGDWDLLAPLETYDGNLGWFVETVRILRDKLADDTPIIVTNFAPMCRAIQFAGIETVRRHIADDPAQLHHGLSTIAHNLAALSRAAIDAGADGIFLAVQGGADKMLTREQYAEFGKPYDLEVLQQCRSGWLNVLHAHGDSELLMDDFLTYPVNVLNWSDRITGLSLREVRQRKPGLCLMGGIHERGPITKGSVQEMEAEIADALEQTDGGHQFILANGCSIPDDSDEAKLHQWTDAAIRFGGRK